MVSFATLGAGGQQPLATFTPQQAQAFQIPDLPPINAPQAPSLNPQQQPGFGDIAPTPFNFNRIDQGFLNRILNRGEVTPQQVFAGFGLQPTQNASIQQAMNLARLLQGNGGTLQDGGVQGIGVGGGFGP